jgi:hypothetical protein
MLNFTLKCSYMLRSMNIIRQHVLEPCVLATRTLHSTQYTHHNLKHMLPQHCITHNDVFLLINSTKV